MKAPSRSLVLFTLLFVFVPGALVSPVASATYVTAVNWSGHIGGPGTGDGQFVEPLGVAADKWGNVFVVSDNRLQKFSADGAFLAKRGTTDPSAEIAEPLSVATDRWGNVYVGQLGNGGRLSRYMNALAEDGFHWDGSGGSDVVNPTGLTVTLDGRLYLADPSAGKLQLWTIHGGYFESRTPLGTPTTGIAASHDEWVYTVTGNATGITESVVRYDLWTGGPTSYWGGHGTADGLFNIPYDVGVDPNENSYVIERAGARGQVFMADSPFLTQFGSLGSGNGQFTQARGIGVGLDRTVYVADTGNARVSKWSVDVPVAWTDVAGPNRYETAVRASVRSYPRGAPSAIVATGQNWPDALGGSALAGAAGAPILLTRTDSLPAVTLEELRRLGPGRVYVLGGEGAVSAAVFDEIAAEFPEDPFDERPPGDPRVIRLGGNNRYDTAIAIAEEVKRLAGSQYAGTGFVCTGANFPDALAAAPIAAANRWPIYLTRKDSIPAEVRTSMLSSFGGNPTNHGYIIGGDGVVGPAVDAELNESPFMGFMRIGGSSRYETAAMLADISYNGMGMLWSRPAIATGQDFPDALAAAGLQGKACSPVLLTRSSALPAETAAVLEDNRQMIYAVRTIGGETAVSTSVRNEVRSILGLTPLP